MTERHIGAALGLQVTLCVHGGVAKQRSFDNDKEESMENRVIRFCDPDREYGYLSNWYMSDFTYAGRTYHSMEQYMMFQKALTFGDLEIADKIMASKDLPEIKKLGRSVAHYNDVLWKTIRVQIMRRGIRAKFQQNPELLYNLLGTGSALMAECAPRDLVWGIGLDIEDARSSDPKEWKGRNQLGRTLMRVREDLRAWCSVAGASVTQYVDAVDLRAPQPIRVSRRNDSDKADRIRRELEAAAGVSENTSDVSSENEDSSEASVWNMPIYEACMLPYLSEITATWMEEVFFNLRRSRSYEDLSVANYTFEELEWMFRSGQSAGLPIAGFFEMKQDIFDLMRYRGGLRNPASLLAQVENRTEDFHELPVDREAPVSEAASGGASEQYEETHIIVDVARRDNRNRLVGTQDPGRTSSPETYISMSSNIGASGDVQNYVPEEGEEATTLFGAGSAEGVRAGDMWSVIRDMADEAQEVTGAAASAEKTEPEGTAAVSEEETASEEIVVENVPYEIVTGTMPDEVVVELETEDEETAEDTTYAQVGSAVAEPETVEYTAEGVVGEEAEFTEIREAVPAGEPESAAEPAKAEEFVPAGEPESAAESAKAAESVPAGEPESAAEPAKAAEFVPAGEPESAAEPAKAEEFVPAGEPESAAEPAKTAESVSVGEPEQAATAEPEEKPWYAEFVKPVTPEKDEGTAAEEASETTAEPAETVTETAAKAEETVTETAETAAEEDTTAAEAETFETTEGAEAAPTEEPAAEDEEYDESDEDESEDEDEELAGSDDEDDEEEEEDFPEPPTPKTQFIPRAEPPQQRPLTYRDEIRSEIVIKHGNIAAVDCDCVVNATNTTLMGGNGFDNSIMKAAGPELLRECAALKGCDVGRAKISGGYRLKAQFVIHTVGPRYSGDETDPVYLTMCYENCLNLAMKYDIHSIAFPPISTGYYGYPLREATRVASRTVQGWMRRHPEYGIKVIFVSADDRTFAMYKDVFK